MRCWWNATAVRCSWRCESPSSSNRAVAPWSRPAVLPVLQVKVCSRVDELDPHQWNALVEDANPFLDHAFLRAMEQQGCVGERFGWLPRHLAILEDGRLVAAMPLYEKHNSYGEFVFDHSWAQAWERSGRRYFPKLVSAIPYTPATGQRLLCDPHRPQLREVLIQTALELAQQTGCSGVHWLFPPTAEQQLLEQSGMQARHDCQFHWHNAGYADFEAFLETLNARKRKSIRQQRRKVRDARVTFRLLDGHTATTEDWARFTEFYNTTFLSKWGMPTFNQPFFEQIGRELPDRVLLVLADLDGECIAGALMYLSHTTLYGRHWGCTREVDQLHFETCYYQGLEFAIARGLQGFEPGAQGRHKIARGFLPVRTTSAHWVADPVFREPVARFCAEEREAVAENIAELLRQSPYRQTES